MPTGLCSALHHGDFEHHHQFCPHTLPDPNDIEVSTSKRPVSLRRGPNYHVPGLMKIRKTGIIIRLGLPLIGVAITLYQIPSVVSRRGQQQYRSLIASIDILLATFTANAVVLGSLLSDRGYKKTKYKHGAAAQGFNIKTKTAGGTRIVRNQWGSDEDLMRTSDVDSKAVVISLETFDHPTVPPKSKFQEIRVNSSWEVHVDEISSTKD